MDVAQLDESHQYSSFGFSCDHDMINARLLIILYLLFGLSNPTAIWNLVCACCKVNLALFEELVSSCYE